MFGKSALKVQKVSPELLIGAGIVGLVAAGVLAARASRDLDPMIMHHDRRRDDIDEAAIPESQRKHEQNLVTKDVAIEVVKMYAPAVTLGAVSIVAILGGHHILKSRNVALAAAYKVLETSYFEYRKRVADEIGTDREVQLYRGQVQETISVDGKKQLATKQKYPHGSPYARIFDEVNSTEFIKNRPDLNLVFLLHVQRFCNAQLNAKGYMFLNDVYEQLGMDRTPAGQMVGWFWNKHPDAGDGHIDFGIDDAENQMAKAFLRGEEAAVWLDFNVDGQIFDKI
jgi:hypothetical protein